MRNAVAIGFASLILAAAPASGDVFELVSKVNEADTRRESDVTSVVTKRRYTLHNKRWERDPMMEVKVIGTPGRIKEFEVIRMENADGMPKRVFLKLLEAEIEAGRRSAQNDESAITSANYDFSPLGSEVVHGRDCMILQLKPKRASKYVIDGKVWIDPVERAIVRVEGRTAKSVSFWIGKPWLTQDFRKVHEMWVSSSNQSVSDVKLLGRTELRIEYLDYQVDRVRQLANR